MKIFKLLNENELEKTDPEVTDEIGKFFVVKKPKKGVTKEDMVYEATVFHPINIDETVGIYKNKSEANRYAVEALKQYEGLMKEVEEAMNEFREAKKGIGEKKKLAKEKIMKVR